jgi:hypothetical protein
VDFAEWRAGVKQEVKDSGESPLGVLPVITVGSKRLIQHVATTRYLAKAQGAPRRSLATARVPLRLRMLSLAQPQHCLAWTALGASRSNPALPVAPGACCHVEPGHQHPGIHCSVFLGCSSWMCLQLFLRLRPVLSTLCPCRAVRQGHRR